MNFADYLSLYIPEGRIKRILFGDTVLWENRNLFDINNAVLNKRQNSSGTETSYNGLCCVTIPVTVNGETWITCNKNIGFQDYIGHSTGYIYFYDASHNLLGMNNCGNESTNYEIRDNGNGTYSQRLDCRINGVSIVSDLSQIAYVRITLCILKDNVITEANMSDIVILAGKHYRNWVPFSIESDGTIFNDVGYMNGKRLSSSGVLKDYASSTCSGFIPVKQGDIIRLDGVKWLTSNTNNYLCYYKADFSFINYITPVNGTGIYQPYYNGISNFTILDNGVLQFEISKLTQLNSLAYIRISACGINSLDTQNGANMIITVNEEIP